MPLRTITLLIALVCIGCSQTSNRIPSDREIEEAINQIMYQAEFHRIQTGDVIVTTALNDADNHAISVNELKEIEAWREAGLVMIQPRRSIDENLNSENISTTIIEAGTHITVTPTELGRKADEASDVHEKDNRYTYARFSDAKVSSLIENNEIKKSVNTYRLVKGIGDKTLTPVGGKVYAAAGWPMPVKFKFIYLIKLDEFEKTWKYVAGDVAATDDPFTSKNVERYLANLPQ